MNNLVIKGDSLARQVTHLQSTNNLVALKDKVYLTNLYVKSIKQKLLMLERNICYMFFMDSIS